MGERVITRSNLAEQLREYQIRSKHDWASVSFFSSTSNIPSRMTVELAMFRCLEVPVLQKLIEGLSHES